MSLSGLDGAGIFDRPVVAGAVLKIALSSREINQSTVSFETIPTMFHGAGCPLDSLNRVL